MPQPARTTVKRMRDITLILSLVEISTAQAKQITAHAEDGEFSPTLNAMLLTNLGEASKKLRTLDGRTGKREKGKGPALTPVATSAAKKAGARRR